MSVKGLNKKVLEQQAVFLELFSKAPSSTVAFNRLKNRKRTLPGLRF